MSWVLLANDHDIAVATQHLALLTHFLDAWTNLHALSRSSSEIFTELLLVPIRNATSGEVIRGDLDLHAVTRQNTNAVHTHLSGAVSENLVSIFQFDLEHGIWQRLDHGPFQDNRVFLRLWQSEISSEIMKKLTPELGNRAYATKPSKASEDTNAFLCNVRHS